MRIRSVFGMFGLAAALAGCAATAQQEPQTRVSATSCQGLTEVDRQVAALYEPGKIDRAEPTYRKEVVTRAHQPRYVSGAQLYVVPERGVSEAYMERVLSCHAASEGAAAHPNDPLRVAGIDDVDVDSVGPSFRITITGVDRSTGKAIWQRARALTSPGSEVQVEQVAAAGAPGRL